MVPKTKYESDHTVKATLCDSWEIRPYHTDGSHKTTFTGDSWGVIREELIKYRRSVVKLMEDFFINPF